MFPLEIICHYQAPLTTSQTWDYNATVQMQKKVRLRQTIKVFSGGKLNFSKSQCSVISSVKEKIAALLKDILTR